MWSSDLALVPPIIRPHGPISGLLDFSDIVNIGDGALEPRIDAGDREANGYSPNMRLDTFPCQVVVELHAITLSEDFSKVKKIFSFGLIIFLLFGKP